MTSRYISWFSVNWNKDMMRDLLSLRFICLSSSFLLANMNVEEMEKRQYNKRKAFGWGWDEELPVFLPFIKECMVDDNVMPLWHLWSWIFITYTSHDSWRPQKGDKMKNEAKSSTCYEGIFLQFFCVYFDFSHVLYSMRI